ncbi:MAG: glycosyltransferase family 2 protein [Gammaproteobacteria bacterium]|nr:glycosyltransferase family 2 protein [Gammaproteobacteria bacterium]
MNEQPELSIVLPAHNEADTLPNLLNELRARYSQAEIIVVDDGSTDGTGELARTAGADHVVTHPYPIGNGAAIKDGARAAHGAIIVFMDADGQHRPEEIEKLLEAMGDDYVMAVGTRSKRSHASPGRRLANVIYNKLASWVTGHHIADLTSGFRAVQSKRFKEILFLLPNGFSYPTTSTMAFFRAGFPVRFVPVEVASRGGASSHIRPLRDGARFLLIILKVATLYSPLKVFTPASGIFFCFGLGYYLFTFFTRHQFTNMSALLFIISGLVFLLGLIAEQIANLLYANTGHE